MKNGHGKVFLCLQKLFPLKLKLDKEKRVTSGKSWNDTTQCHGRYRLVPPFYKSENPVNVYEEDLPVYTPLNHTYVGSVIGKLCPLQNRLLLWLTIENLASGNIR